VKERWTVSLIQDLASESTVPMPNRIRSLLKHALRAWHLRNQGATETGNVWTIVFEMAGTVLGEPLSMRVGKLCDNAWIYGLMAVSIKGVHADGSPVQVEDLVDNSSKRGIP
jgi:hypothetical protein